METPSRETPLFQKKTRNKGVFFICGPEKFQESIKEMLVECGVSKNNVNVESFEVKKKTIEKPSLNAPKMLAFCSTLTFFFAAIFFLLPSWKPMVNSVFGKVDSQILSGYSILGMIFLGMILSIPKRTKFLSAIKFEYVRIFHIALGLISLGCLSLHTGFHLGSNLNFLLMLNFLLIAILGSLAGNWVFLENKYLGDCYFKFREFFKTLHWVISWPLPTLLIIHIISIYYY